MPVVDIDGLPTHYEVVGEGSPMVLFSPGGFDGALTNWSTMGRYRELALVDHLRRDHRCILFDKRGSGRSGGRVERVGWQDYAAQGLGLLDHLGIERAHLMGGCVGCSIAVALAVRAPERVASLVLFQPAGGPRYRLKQQARFARHLAHVAEAGLAGVVALARRHEEGFAADPRVGPWVSLLRRDEAFASAYAELDPDRYLALVAGLSRTMFDRDTVPGAEPEDLLQLDVPALVVPGQDTSHAPSAAQYLHECLASSSYVDVPVAEQTGRTVATSIAAFLADVDG